RSIDDVVDDVTLLGLRGHRVDLVDEHCDVVQQRLLGGARIAGMELDVSAADLDARMTLERTLCSVETKRPVVLRRLLGVNRIQRDVVEVVLHLRRRFDKAHSNALAELDLNTIGKVDSRTIEIRHAQRNVLESTFLTWAFGREERQLPAPRIGADQRERILPV